MNIRAVFFDFGGVLYRTPDRGWIQRWLRILGLQTNKELNDALFDPDESPYFHALMEGRIQESDFWDQLGSAWRLSPLLVRWLRKNAMSHRRLNREVADFLGGLRPRYRTAILSNAGTDARRMFVDIFGFDRLVDEMIISAEEGVAKPDERIYRIALERLGVEPAEAVFLDDLVENVAAARQLGMQAVHFRETRSALEAIHALI
jgi:epoxide hydrolase-like predicted phosphatase